MNRSKKAALLSAVVFPGAGHWYLGKRKQAIALFAASAVATYVLVAGALAQANLIADKVISGELEPEISQLMVLLQEQISANETSSMSTATIALVVIWMVGVVGAWIAGRK